jgi:hypothetical protein
MVIKSPEVFAKECVLHGRFLGINSHYLMAAAHLRSGIKDDTAGDRVGPFRVTQQEWDSNGGAADLEIIMEPADINSWRLQCLFAALTAYRAQTLLLVELGGYPSALQLYRKQFPDDVARSAEDLQASLDQTLKLVTAAIDDVEQPALSPQTGSMSGLKRGQELFALKAPRIMEKLIDDFDFKPFQAAGILGNIGLECDGFHEMQEKKPLVPGSRGGFGWAQWTGERRDGFEAFCAAGELITTSDSANYGFLKKELTSSHASSVTAVSATSNLAQAVRAFEREFEKAKDGLEHFDRRDGWADLALRTFKATAASRVPVAVAGILDPDSLYSVVASATSGNDTFWIVDQFAEDGAQVLIKQTGMQAPQILASDTALFPLQAGLVPAMVAAKLGASLTAPTEPPPLVTPPPASDADLRARIFAEAQKCVDTLISRNVDGTKQGRLACAWAVNEVVRRAVGKPIGGGLSTTIMGAVLLAKHIPIQENDVGPGMIVISPTGRKVGHVGIVGSVANPISATPIYSNSSQDGKFEKNLTIAKWKRRYIDAQGLPVLYYALRR